jgi:hypothetical protein
MSRFGFASLIVPLFLFSSWSFSISGEIYRWTDPRGGVHFTDDILKVPAPYRDQAEKRNSPEKSPANIQKDAGSEEPAGPAWPSAKDSEKPDRVKAYLEAVEEKITARKKIEKRISELEEEMEKARERIKYLEKDEEDNHPQVQPHFRRRGFVPVAGTHFKERQDLSYRIKDIQKEIAALEEKLSEIKRGL